MNPPIVLRPLSLGQLLDQAIRIYRHNFIKFIGILAVVEVPAMLLQTIASTMYTSSMMDRFTQTSTYEDYSADFLVSYFGKMLAFFALSMVTIFLTQLIGASALTRGVTDSLLGEPVTILGAYRKIGATWQRLLLVFVLLGLIGIAVGIWLVVPCVGWVTSPSILALLFMVIGPLVIPIIMIEDKTSTQAIRRAWDLVRRRFWPVIGFVFILSLFAQIVITGPTLLISSMMRGVTGVSTNLTSQTIINAIIQSIVGLISGLLYLPLQWTAFTLFYLDLRVRTEGLDLAWQTASLGVEISQASGTAESASDGQPFHVEADGMLLRADEVAPQPTDLGALLAQAPPAESGPLIESKEWGYIALLSLAVAGIYLVLVGIAFAFIMLIAGIGQGLGT